MSSLKEFLKQYPSFLDKTENSNFYKHVEIYNKQRLELLQQINNIQLSRNIERPIQIQKSQNTHNTAVYYFYIYLEDIKSVKIIREDTNEVIEEKQYNEKGHSKVFFRYQVYSKDVIPNPRFHVIVETYNEYTYEKGYPENDILMGNIYDHDTNLDMLGKILGVSRYNHITVNESEYPYTIPPYFNKATEDDYYYQERIKTYISRFAYYYDISNNQYDALPLLEFWKYYGFNPIMKNRKILLSSQEGVKDINDWTSYDDDDDTFYSPVNGPVSSVYDITVDPLSSVRYQIQSILNMDKLEKAEPVELNLDINVDSVSCRLGDSVTVTGVVTDVDSNLMYGIPVDLYVNGTAINKDITNSKNSSITNNQGVITFIYTPSKTGLINFHLSVTGTEDYNSSSSNIIDVTVINPTLFSDNCTEDNTSQYNTIQIVKNATTTLTFDTDHYQITGSSNYVAGYSIPNTDNMDNVEADMTIKNMVNSAYNQLWFGLMDTDTGEDYMFRLRGDKLFQTELINTSYSHESSEDIVTNIPDITTSKHSLKLVKKGTSFTGTLLNSNGEILGSKELTLPSISNYKYVFGVWCEKGTSTSEVDIYSIKAVQL